MKLIDLKDTIDYLVEKHGGQIEVTIFSDSECGKPIENIHVIESSYVMEILIT
jgi:hypothetical protein